MKLNNKCLIIMESVKNIFKRDFVRNFINMNECLMNISTLKKIPPTYSTKVKWSFFPF